MTTTKSLPLLLPAVYGYAAGVTPQPDVDTGGYDFSIGGCGFRFATDQQNPYQRVTEPTTNNRFDNSSEPGEQSLAPLPWIKSQSSFHGGAGQVNLEQGFTSFQYQQEQVARVRFDTCLGVDVWTPGRVTRLPTTRSFAPARSATAYFVSGSGAGLDYVVAGGVATLYRMSWPTGVDNAPTVTDITMTGYGGLSNVEVQWLVSDGTNYYAYLKLTADATVTGAGVRQAVVSGSVASTAEPTLRYKVASDSLPHQGILGWAKSRLLAGIEGKLYELDPLAAAAALPVAKYTHPLGAAWVFTDFCEAPTAILASGRVGLQSEILSFQLDTSGATPTLTGGVTVAQLPHGEDISSLCSVLGSFLAVGTNRGVRIGTFDTYSGALKVGPTSVVSTSYVKGLVTRDRFVYGTWSNQMPDGSSGLVRVDVSYVVDATGRNAWAPDLRPPSTEATPTGTIADLVMLPNSARLVWYTPTGFHVEGNGPSADGTAYVQTSRIRYDTAEQKLFKSGRITGELATATITVTAVQPFGTSTTVGTFGFLVDGNPGEFDLPTALSEWMQLRFALNGATAELDSYQVKAYPAPKVQDVLTLTANCFSSEVDRGGLDVIDPSQPRDRFEAVRQLKLAGKAVRYVEYTNRGAVALTVLIDQVAFQSYSRPSSEDDFGGYLTMKLRVVQ